MAKLGAATITVPGTAGVVGATQQETKPKNVHPEDKMILRGNELSDQSSFKTYLDESDIWRSRADGQEGVLYYIDPIVAKQQIDFTELSIPGEKSISGQLTETKEFERAEEDKREQKRKVDEEVAASKKEKSSQNSGPEIGLQDHNGDVVNIGEDTTLTSYDYTDSGVGGIWGNKSSDADSSDDTLHAEIAQAPSYGNAYAWAYIADEFEVSGDSQAFCNFTSDVSYDGYLFSAAGATSEVTITWKLENTSAEEEYEGSHLDESYTAASSTNYLTDTDGDAEVVQLTPGDHYRASVRLEVHTNVQTAQGATADFGSLQDNDEQVKAQQYSLDFSN